MKVAIAVAVLFAAVVSFQPSAHAQNAYQYQSDPWQNVQNMLQSMQTPYQNNYLLQQYYSPQNQYWQQMQEMNTFQQQYQNQYNNQWLKPYQVSPYSYNEPEVYAPRVAIPGGDVLLEPGDDVNTGGVFGGVNEY